MAGPAPTLPAPRVLVVEDEPKVARALREGLSGEGYEVVVAQTGEDGFFRASSEPFDLLILDRMRATRSRTAWTASTPGPTTTW
jgi:DNA-binding response OmpR family regulator